MRYLVMADNHLRSDVPICRTETQEEWLAFQEEVLQFIVDEANKAKADILCAGDLTDSPHLSDNVMSMFLRVMAGLKGKFYTIGGNHVLPWRREANVFQSSVGLIKALHSDKLIYCDSEEHVENSRFEHSHRLNDEITLVHTLTFKNEDDVPFSVEAMTAQGLLDKYDTKWIISGDMHKPFVYENDDRFVINPGKMTIQTVGEMNEWPVVYLIDTTEGLIVERKLPHDPSKVSDEHITRKREKQAELESVLEAIKSGKMDVSLDYVKNLFYYVEHNKVKQDVIAILDEIKEGIE